MLRLALAGILNLVCLMGVTGCSSSPERSQGQNGVSHPISAIRPEIWNHVLVEHEIAGTSVEGRPIELVIIRDRDNMGQLSSSSGTRQAQTVLLIAGIHGNEPAGIPLLSTLLDEAPSLQSALQNRTVVMLPCINPDGVFHQRRTNLNHVDLNRNFDSANWKKPHSRRHGPTPLSEPESQIIVDVIARFKPTRILTIHQPIGCIDYDGPNETQEIAFAMAESIMQRLPVRKLGTRNGSLGSFAGVDLGLPTLTVELKRGDEKIDASELWDMYGSMILTFIAWPESTEPVY